MKAGMNLGELMMMIKRVVAPDVRAGQASTVERSET